MSSALPPAAPLTWIGEAYQWACTRLYHEFAWAYDPVSVAVSAGRWDAWRRAVLTYVQGDVVLEVGCGTGALLGHLAAPGRTVLGLDASPQMLRVARRRRDRGHAQFVRGRSPNIPLTSGAIDCIVATFPAPYILEQTTLVDLARLLATGGRVVVGGLWVEPTGPLRVLPLVYGRPGPATFARLQASFAQAGLRATCLDVDVAGDHVGVVVAERC